ncbi:MAG: iron transporter [Ottowia sp.]|nr:iron transporter [Ottowia sp.]
MSLLSQSKNHYPSTVARLTAEQRSQQALLNCYIREVALPENQLTVVQATGTDSWPMTVNMVLQQQGGSVIHIALPYTHKKLLAVVAHPSLTGNFRYRAGIWCQSTGDYWRLLEGMELATLLLNELALKYELPLNTDLIAQIHDSIQVTTALLSSAAAHTNERFSNHALEAYIDSEQSLIFGHPFHPAPKSRQGFSKKDTANYSPEMRCQFPLHYFAVPREDICQQSLLTTPCDQLIAPTAPSVDSAYVAIPTHPWQAHYLCNLPLLKQAIDHGRLLYLGPQGNDFFPTASIRTLYQPGHPYFYKFSLNVRVTNCIRKNAWYELESAMHITRLIRPLLSNLQKEFQGIHVLEEPAFMSVDMRAPDAHANNQIIEGFGLILRENFEKDLLPQAKPLLAGALFGNHAHSERRLSRLLEDMAHAENMPIDAAIEQWFFDYVKTLMLPVLYCYFKHGLVFEPHLQNVMIGIQAGWPRQIFLRDFEGVKLVREHYDEAQLSHLSARARESLCYSQQQGWNRIAYCLFVNNFCEAIHQLAPENVMLQNRLWAVVQQCLHAYQAAYGDSHSAAQINALRTKKIFPAKTNLLNRFLKNADKEAAYVCVPQPIGFTMGTV